MPSSLRASPKILFFPDQHLGRNTAFAMGYPMDKMIVWDPTKDLGGNTEQQIRDAIFVLWKGHCSVHQLFRPEHIDAVRREHPNMKVIVHPECRHEVVEKADLAGSTAYIVKQIEAAPPGSEWAVGTEVHLVNRLKQQHPEQTIRVLSDCQCLCTTMYRIDLPHLCWAMENLVEGIVVNEIRVDSHTRHKWATLSRSSACSRSKEPVTPSERNNPWGQPSIEPIPHRVARKLARGFLPMIEIPPGVLHDDILTNLLEEFVTRDGTDPTDAAVKIAQVRHLLKLGQAVILFDEESETTTIVVKDRKSLQ